MAGRLILDSGAVIGWQRGQAAVWARVAEATRQGVSLVIPAVVVAECVRGGAGDVMIHRLLATARVPLIGARIALLAGRLLGETGMSATIDALIVAEALDGGSSVILTGDPGDIKALVGDRTHVQVIAI
jgi:hypothetical protein